MFGNLKGSWKVVKKATGTGAEWRGQESSKWVRKVTVTSLGHVLLVAMPYLSQVGDKCLPFSQWCWWNE